ncbi:ribokinase-like [Battus philenor]|uniref:ribokinase-like n=1 Tax=Battus philenor TaxID=42288 RepID=UPI0035CFC9D7
MENNDSTQNKIVVIGSSSVDFAAYAPRLPKPGETLHGYKFVTSFGGKGTNQCVAASKLGANAYLISRLGDDKWGKQYKEYLKEIGVDVTHVCLTSEVATGIAQITVAENGENHIVIVPGANNYLNCNDVKVAEEIIKTADVIIGQLETPIETTLEAFKLSNAIKILNAAPARKDIDSVLSYCTILCVNETEASCLVDISVDLSNASSAVSKLLEFGCQTVIITLGDKGAVYSSKFDKRCFHVLCENVTPVDTTGAGDAFVGALATYLVTYKDLPLHQIVGAACKVATMSVTKEGTQTSFPTKFDAFGEKYKFVELQ